VTSGGDLSIGGDLVGRDKVVHGYTAEQVQTLLASLAAQYQPRPFDGRCPYPGLEPFREADAGLFFGREALSEHLLKRLAVSNGLMVIGPSGSGKSSLVRAGLIPALKGGALEASAHWRLAVLTPGRSPLLALGRVLPALCGSLESERDLVEKSFEDDTRLTRWIQSGLSGDNRLRAVLVVDQFEEVFTQTPAEAERSAFIAQLMTALDQASGSIHIVLVMRSDFIGACARYPALNAWLGRGLVQVGALTPDELVRAVALPALRVGLRVDPALIAQVMADLRGEPGALPLLQFTLRDLFEVERGPDGVPALSLEGYLRRGGLHEALRRHADGVFASLSPEQQALAREILRVLVSVGQAEGAPLTRRTARVSELPGPDAEVEAVVARLATGRLLTVDDADASSSSPPGDHPAGAARTVTLAHEKLLEAWPLLAGWIAQDREGIRLRATVLDDAVEWMRRDRDVSYLYTGARLTWTRDALRTRALRLPDEAAAFLDAAQARAQELAAEAETARQAELARSQADVERELRVSQQLRARNRWITIVGVVAVSFALLAAIAGGLAGLSALNASRAAATAQAANTQTTAERRWALARAAALQARDLAAQGETDLAVQLAAEAVRIGLTQGPRGLGEVNVALQGLLSEAARGGQVIAWNAPNDLPFLTLRADSARTQLAFFDDAGRAGLWTIADDAIEPVEAPGVTLTTAGFTGLRETRYLGRDGRGRIAIADETGQVVGLLASDRIQAAALSPDGARVLTAEALALSLWTDTGEPVASVALGPRAYWEDVAFTRDGQRLLAYDGLDGLVLLDLNLQVLWRLQSEDGPWAHVAASADGSRVAAISAHAVTLWHDGAPSGRLPLEDPGPLPDGLISTATALAWNADGSALAVGMMDGRVLVLDGAGAVTQTLTGHRDAITTLAFSPVEAADPVLVSGSADVDGTVRVWSRDGALLAVLQPEGQSRDVSQVAVVEGGSGPLGGAIVVFVPESGAAWRWRVQPTLAGALDEAAFVTGRRLDAASCRRFFDGPCEP